MEGKLATVTCSNANLTPCSAKGRYVIEAAKQTLEASLLVLEQGSGRPADHEGRPLLRPVTGRADAMSLCQCDSESCRSLGDSFEAVANEAPGFLAACPPTVRDVAGHLEELWHDGMDRHLPRASSFNLQLPSRCCAIAVE